MKNWWTLAAVGLGVLAVGLDGTVLSVALPTLASGLDASQSDLTWFSSGYLLVLAAATLPAGVLGDRFGRKKVLLASLVAFGAGSVVCACAGTPAVFLAGRALQGVAGAGVTVMALSALVVLFPDEQRPKAVGVYQAANFLALPLGPLLGGWMLTHVWWGWVFLINVPVVLLALGATVALVPESRAAERPGLDPVGTAASTLGLVLTIGGLIRAGEKSWTDPGALTLLLTGTAAIAGFAVWERFGASRPLVDPALFRSRSFLWGSALAAVAGVAMIGVLFVLPQFFQDVQGADTFSSGLRLLPLIAGMVLGAALAAPLGRAAGTRAATAIGFGILAAGLLLGAAGDAGSGLLATSTWIALVGAGTGTTLATATSAALSGLDAERSGVGSAVVQAFQKTAGPFGTAIFGSVLVAVYQHRAPAGAVRGLSESVPPTLREAAILAFVAGFRVSLLVSAAVAVVGAVAAMALLPSRHATQDPPSRREQPDAVHR
ncbi:MFS transporter [Cryptosporangium sp. NPDC051539]|uniref:MFS transporter n=1 Tax=Cryptosporangium sp. NPDC051539 TaxID=3363962 RepID=UPI0037BE14AF